METKWMGIGNLIQEERKELALKRWYFKLNIDEYE